MRWRLPLSLLSMSSASAIGFVMVKRMRKTRMGMEVSFAAIGIGIWRARLMCSLIENGESEKIMECDV